MQMGEGERLESARRRRFWIVLGAIMGAGAVVGFVTGFFASFEEVPANEVWSRLPAWLAILLVASGAIVFSVGCWVFMKSIDEVETADNLWASTLAYYVYAVSFPAWWALAEADVLPEPDGWLIYFAAVGGGLALYLWRKWRAR